MIARWVVDEILDLLRQKAISQRAIARRLGVSRGTVNAIAQGKRPDYQQDELDGFFPAAGPARRCPGCGGMVFMPCLLCHVRAIKSETGAR